MAVYALMVGIDAYKDPVSPLLGAVRDVRHALSTLRGLAGEGLHPLVLTDAAATRAAIIDGFRTHLSRAQADDAAVFWFSGHGSQAPVPPRFARLEPTGMMQTLVCADSRRDTVPDLLDKELALLIAQVAATGAHVVTILDCCHGGGATRASPAEPDTTRQSPAPTIPDGNAWLRARWTPPARLAPEPMLLLPELSAAIPDPNGPDGATAADVDLDMDPGTGMGAAADHVSLAACQVVQSAYELPTDDGWRGVFSMMLLKSLAQPGLTYRELLARTRCSVETAVPGQWPALYPMLGDLADRPFLGGRVRLPPSPLTLRHRHGSWQVDAGACHGLTAGTQADPTLLGLYGDPLRRQVRVLRVEAYHSVVEPVGWRPADEDEHHPVVVTRISLPATGVAVASTVHGLDDAQKPAQDARGSAASAPGSKPRCPTGGPGPEAGGGANTIAGTRNASNTLAGHDSSAARRGAAIRAALIARQVACCGPGGVPSPFVRVVAADKSGGFADLIVTFPSPTTARVCGADGTPLSPARAFSEPGHVRRLVLDLEHIARWRLIKTLQNPSSPLAGAVALEIVEARPHEQTVTAGAAPLRPDASGAVRIRSRQDPDGRYIARIFMRLHNTASRRLYCVLLTMTDRFEMHPALFPGSWVEPGRPAPVAAGAPIHLVLPRRRIIEAGDGIARTDWFTILAAEEPFGPEPFHLPALGAFTGRAAPSVVFSGLLDRLGSRLLDRDLPPGPPPACDWTTSTVTVITLVPTA